MSDLLSNSWYTPVYNNVPTLSNGGVALNY